jgi:hypothetical protein
LGGSGEDEEVAAAKLSIMACRIISANMLVSMMEERDGKEEE